MQFTYRPLPNWPFPATPWDQRRSRWTFKASWSDTLDKLEYEIGRLDGSSVVFGIGLEERDIRKDGLPRADARPARHPGVEISFDSRHGRLTYSTDSYELWQHNVRAIALGLEYLRGLDRYGITRRGEQYAGWAQLTAGGPDPERGRALVEAAGGITMALRKHHPDAGGDARDFIDVQTYRAQAGS